MSVSGNGLGAGLALHCPRCAEIDPTLHAAEPRGPGDWLLVSVAVVVLVAALVAAVKALWFPGEQAPHHVKRSILDDSVPGSSVPAEVQGHE